jgi:hypothetical protein
MNQWHDPVGISPAREFRLKKEQSNAVIASPLTQTLLDFEEGSAFEILRLVERVRTGAHVWNAEFDRILPACWRRFSIVHWTPLHVARRAAQLLVTGPGTRVLDVGSGPGKFCLVGALTTPGHFTGAEQRPYLAEFSRSFARRYSIPRVRFLCGNAPDLDWRGYSAFYFYNPFYENLDPDRKLDERFELSPSLYDRYIKMTQNRLAQAPSGTRVVTFHGMGGDMPDGYERVLQEFQDIGFLELWIKNPSPEQLNSLQKISRQPGDSQAPCLSALDRAGTDPRLWVSICASPLDTTHIFED